MKPPPRSRRTFLRGLLAGSAGAALTACHRFPSPQPELPPVEALPDLRLVPADLVVPEAVVAPPAPGRRVRQGLEAFAATDVHHLLYLPVNWQAGERYPVIVEYAGNGPHVGPAGDVSTGQVEGSKLGYGLSGGRDFLWLCLPYVNVADGRNQLWWWGDVDATLRYARDTIAMVCREYGGDPTRVLLAGFSRGAIGCNFLGLHDDAVAGLWRAFFPYSHYDGVRLWDYPGSDRAAALTRLRRLNRRPQFVSHERSVEPTRLYLASTGVRAPFTFLTIPFRNHDDGWTLRDIPARAAARRWLHDVMV